MKRILSITFAFVGLVAAVSCQKETLNSGDTHPRNLVPLTLTVDGSKTALVDGTSVVFNAGDEIAVFDGTAVQKFITAEGGASAVFSGGVTEGSTDLYAVYPYDGEMTFTEGVIRTQIPRIQYADQPGSFGKAANVSVGKTTVSEAALEMFNATSLMKITISQENIDSVLVSGLANEKISGPIKVTLADAETPMGVASSKVPNVSKDNIIQNEVILKADDGGHIAPGSYYLAVKPCELSGVRFLIYGNDGKGALLTSNTPVTLNRAKSRDFKTIDSAIAWRFFTNWNIRFKKVANLWENENTSSNWPFGTLAKGTSGAHASSSTFTSATYGYQITVNPEIEYYLNSKNGLFFFPVADTYFELPVIPGMKLISVGFSGGASNIGEPSFVAADGSSLSGGEQQSPSQYTLFRWNFSGTDAAKAYRMLPGKTGTWAVFQILLTYLGKKPASISSVSTENATNVTETTATLNGTVAGEIQDVSDITCGFYYRVKGSGSEFTKVSADSALEFSKAVTGLSAGTTYEYKAYASAGAGEVEGSLIEFETNSASALTIPLKVSYFTAVGMPNSNAYSSSGEDHPATIATYTITVAEAPYDFTFSAVEVVYSSKYFLTFARYNNDYFITGKTPVNVKLPIGSQVGNRSLKTVKFTSNATTTFSLQTKNSSDEFVTIDSAAITTADTSAELTVPAEYKNCDNYYFKVGKSTSKWRIDELVYE